MKITIKKIEYTNDSIRAQVKFSFDEDAISHILSDFNWQENVDLQGTNLTIGDVIAQAKEQFNQRLQRISDELKKAPDGPEELG
jgi:hypothetical protein